MTWVEVFGLGLKDLGFRVWCLGLVVKVPGSGSGFRVWG